jgi:phosphatidylglycerol:prolipoprotein diacylglycerol transferase
MYPVLFRIPIPAIPGLLPNGAHLPVFSYGTLIALGFLLTYLYVCWLSRQQGIDEENITDLYLVIIITSIIGARLNYVATNWQEYISHPASIFKVWEGGMVYLGGVIGAIVGCFAYLRFRGLDFATYADMYGPAVPFASAVGRIGCYLNGCCYGLETNLWCGIRVPLRFGVLSNPRHPTQLYECIVLFIICVLLHLYYRSRPRRGMVFVAFGYTYAIERFLIEFIREESVYEHFPPLGFTLGQTTCLAVITIAFLYHMYLRRTPEAVPEARP